MSDDTIILYTDGAYSGLRNQGGWAFYIPKYKLKVCNNQKETTNNQMELMAVIQALNFIESSNLPETHIIIYSDSGYVIGGMTGKYNICTNQNLWQEINNIKSKLCNRTIEIQYIKAHTGERNGNYIVDQLANLMSQINNE